MKFPILSAVSIVWILLLSSQSFASESLKLTSSIVSDDIIETILEQGVPELSLKRILQVTEGQWGDTQVQSTYRCKGKPLFSLDPCFEDERTPTTTTVELKAFRYAISIDYSLSSLEPRLYFIDLETGRVEKQLVAHGVGSGDGLYAQTFSNIMNSRMTSVGMFLIGGTYKGKYGETLRLYGLEETNDDAYNRDIVFHGAWYSRTSFIDTINPKTDEPYGRLGLSHGCPAVSPENMSRYLKLFKAEGGGYLDHFHPDFTPDID